MKSALLGLVVLGFSVSVAASARAEDQEPRTEFHLLLKDMLKERQTVRSGEVRIRGNKIESSDGVKKFEGDVRATYLFDAAASSYRYELVTQANLIIDGPAKKYDVKFWCCLNPQYYATIGNIPEGNFSNSLMLHPPSRDAGRQLEGIEDRRPFDPLASGLGGYFESLRGDTAEGVSLGMQSKQVESYQRTGSTATIGLLDETARHTLVVDLELRAPLKLTSRSLSDPSVFTNTAKWKRIGGVVVPTEFKTRMVVTPEEGGGAFDHELRFEWLRINERFDPEEFKYRAFKDPPLGGEVFDARGAAVRYLGVLKDGGEVVKDVRDNPVPRPPRFPPRP